MQNLGRTCHAVTALGRTSRWFSRLEVRRRLGATVARVGVVTVAGILIAPSMPAAAASGASASSSGAILSPLRAGWPPQQAVRPARGSTWRAGFESGDFSEWTWWRRNDGCSLSTGEPGGPIPPLEGERAGRFETSRACLDRGKSHSKLFKEWALASPQSRWRDDGGRPLERLPKDSPTGAYRASFFVARGYRASEPWTNIFQLKESYLDDSGASRQDPQWWLNISPAGQWSSAAAPGSRPDAPVLHVNHWGQDYSSYRPSLRLVPLGRWFEIRAEIFAGERIDWYLDDELFDRSVQGEYPIGFSKSRPTGWTFGVGHYDGVGALWVDDASFASPTPSP